MIDRRMALAELLKDAGDCLIVTGLGNAANDMVALTGNADRVFAMDGAMGAAVPVGLGLALAQPDHPVVVVTGDGELLMNVGILATVAVQGPGNLTVVCLDNGAYALTGGQATHTAHGTDLAAMALAAGFPTAATVREPADLPHGRRELATGTPGFVLVKVAPENTHADGLDRDGVSLRLRFSRGLATGRWLG